MQANPAPWDNTPHPVMGRGEAEAGSRKALLGQGFIRVWSGLDQQVPPRRRVHGCGGSGMIRADLPLRVLEPMLDRGELFIRLHTGSEYKIRRNGHTKRWKTRAALKLIEMQFNRLKENAQ